MKNKSIRFGISIFTALSLASACSAKKSSTPEDTAEPTASTEPGVTTNTGNSLAVAGKLNLALGLRGLGFSLADSTTKGVVLFTLDYTSKLASPPTAIAVSDDGSFTIPIERNRLEKLESAIVGGVVNRTIAKEIFPQYATEIDSMSDAELVEGLTEEIDAMKKHPDMRYVLVSYDISGDKEAEAKSMQFIGLPTSGSALKLLPGDALKGDLNLGLITGSGDEATSTLTAADSLELSSSVLEEMAGASQTLKFLKNVWMNPDSKAEVTPWFSYTNADVASTVNKFTTPSGIVYTGGGYYIKPVDIGATWGEVCPPNPANASDKTGTTYSATPAKIVKWYPPIDLLSSTSGETFGPTNPYTNAGGSYQRQDQYGETSCAKASTVGGGMYTRASAESDTDFQLQLGDYIKGKTPEGLWRLKVDATEQGRWDLSAAAPYDKDGDPVIYVPAIKVITDSAGMATGFQAKFYFYDKATKAFREALDTAGVESLVHSFNMDGGYSLTHTGGDLSVHDITIADGIVSGALPAADQAIYPCPADPSSVQCINKLGFSYFIGNISYRMSINPNLNP